MGLASDGRKEGVGGIFNEGATIGRSTAFSFSCSVSFLVQFLVHALPLVSLLLEPIVFSDETLLLLFVQLQSIKLSQ